MTSPPPPVPIPENAGASETLLRPYGQYVLVRKLAEGGMAEIFLAKLLGTDGFERNVVIKRMLPHLSNIPDFVEMFRDEARLAAKLAHPHIIQIHELGFTEGCYYICMEYLAGEDFSTTLRLAGRRRQYVPLPVVLRVLIDAAQGLHYAHEFTNEQGQPLHVVHRDVSPSNLYLTYQGQVKVLDFGIAKAESRLVHTRTGVVKGKYMYMAPEQAQGKEVDRRADVFALGVSLYEAVTHVRPFARENDLAVLNALLQGDFQRPRALRPDLPEELEAVILKAMSFRPEDRYPTAEAFAEELEGFLAENLSASGTSMLGAFLRGHFGEERFTEKTRIPTLATLSATHPTEGVPVVPGQATGLATPTQGGTAAYGASPRTQALEPASSRGPSAVPAAVPVSSPRRWRTLGAGLVGGLLLAGGAFLAARQLGVAPVAAPAGTGLAAAVGAPGAATAPAAGSGDAARAAGTSGGATATGLAAAPGAEPGGPGGGLAAAANGATAEQAGTTAPAPGGAVAPASVGERPSDPVPATGSGPGAVAVASAQVPGGAQAGDDVEPATATSSRKTSARPSKLVTLGISDIQRVVSGGRSRITGCFERYKTDLPSSEGEVQVQLTIISSGKVKADTKGPLGSTGVGRCLEAQAQRLRFPAHRDQEVTVMMPFSWRVTQ